MSRPADLVRRAAHGTGLADAIRQRHAVASLTVAVDEGSRLAVLLEAQVAAIEQSLVPLLESDRRARQQ